MYVSGKPGNSKIYGQNKILRLIWKEKKPINRWSCDAKCTTKWQDIDLKVLSAIVGRNQMITFIWSFLMIH